MKLPFDILGDIFKFYAETETLFHPLETLLLVCRSWNEAALGHHKLWTHFRIYIGHDPTVTIWRARLPLRLKRCGHSLPLDIDIRNMLVAYRTGWEAPIPEKYDQKLYRLRSCIGNKHSCACLQSGFLCIYELLVILGGPNGIFCKRWRSLYLELHDADYQADEYDDMLQVFCNPMPRLISLAVYGLLFPRKDSDIGTFSHTSSLRAFTSVGSANLMPLMAASMRSLTLIPGSRIWFHFQWYLPDAVKYVEEITFQGYISLPNSLPNLRMLDARGSITWMTDEQVQMPSLTDLNIHDYDEDWLRIPLQSCGPAFSRVVSFGLNLGNTNYTDSCLRERISQLLQLTKNLASIHGDSRGVRLILKLIWEAEEASTREDATNMATNRLLRHQVVTIQSEKGSVRLQGNESCEQLSILATALHVYPLNIPWESLLV